MRAIYLLMKYKQTEKIKEEEIKIIEFNVRALYNKNKVTMIKSRKKMSKIIRHKKKNIFIISNKSFARK